MAIRPILEAPDPRLRTISTPVEAIDDDLQTLIDDMFETMYDAPGIGLAAIQVGVPKRVLVMDSGPGALVADTEIAFGPRTDSTRTDHRFNDEVGRVQRIFRSERAS